MKVLTGKKVLAMIFVVSSIFMLRSLTQAHPDGPEPPKNLKVLPKNISHDELISVMRGFTASLGVKCITCHVGTPTADGKMDFDFASDAKPEKETARHMMKMVTAINGKYLKKIGGGHFEEISCVTCHRGNVKPMVSVDSLPKQEKH